MKPLDELREFVSEMRFRVDSSDYFALIDYVDEIYDEFNDINQRFDNIKSKQKWNKIELRKCNDEEKEFYETDFIWIGMTPEVDEEVLVTNGIDYMVYKWIDSTGEICFDAMDDEFFLWWMLLPKLPK